MNVIRAMILRVARRPTLPFPAKRGRAVTISIEAIITAASVAVRCVGINEIHHSA